MTDQELWTERVLWFLYGAICAAGMIAINEWAKSLLR